VSSDRPRAALVTGADNPAGIGRAICRELARSGHAVAFTLRVHAEGERAAICDELVAELRALGAPIAAGLAADLADPGEAEPLLAAAGDALDGAGPLAVLVNNAAHSERDGYAALDAAGIDAHLAVNARAPMLLSCALAQSLEALPEDQRPAGRIVNLVSGQFLGPMPGELAYTASKGALEAFTRQLAAEVAHLGVTVNAVGPGPNDTGWIDDELRAALLPRFPRGRVGRPEDVAPLIGWLCSEQAGWVTGQVVHAEGGFLR
jgi:3-oxoacyl-[acyl-carrier protein] reductase